MDVVDAPAEGDDPLQGLTLGSQQWQEAVFRHYRKAAWRGAVSVLGNETHDSADAEDVVTEIFLEVCEGRHIDANTKSIPGVLYSRARQRALDKAKRGAKTAPGELAWPAVTDSAFERVDDDDERQRVGAIAHDNLHLLSEREQYVRRRLFVDGATPAAVGADLGVTRERIMQIRKALVKKLLNGSGIG